MRVVTGTPARLGRHAPARFSRFGRRTPARFDHPTTHLPEVLLCAS